MIEGLRPYPKYRPCDLAWARRVPTHWGLPRLGSILEERKETNDAREIAQVLSVLKDIGVVPYEQKGNVGNKKSEDTRRYKIVRPDDIVMNSMNVIIGSVGRSRYTGCLSPVYYVLKRRFAEDDPRYLEAIFKVKPFQQSLVRIGNGILAHRLRIPMELLKCELLPKPSPKEQVAIVQFLGHANRRIDQFIRAKKKLIALLNEQSQAIIHRAVTRGLNPTVPMKDPKVPWFNEMPTHWDARALGRISRVIRGASPRPAGDPRFFEGDHIPWLTVGEITKDQAIYVRETRSSLTRLGADHSITFRKGTLVPTNSGATLGVPKILGMDVCANDGVVAFDKLSSALNPVFAYYYLSTLTQRLRKELRQGGTQPNLNTAIVSRIVCPVPSMKEQLEIVDFLESELSGTYAALTKTDREIGFMREYRTRLIADVVTGQLDVREAVKSLPPDEPSVESTDSLDDDEEIDEDEDA